MHKFIAYKGIVLIFLDIIVINLAYFFSFILRFDISIPAIYIKNYIKVIPVIIMIYIGIFIIFKIYKSIWENASIDELIRGLMACITAGCITLILNNIINILIPNSLIISSSILIFMGTVCIRLSYRIFRRMASYGKFKTGREMNRVLVIGAGSCGRIVIDEMYKNENINMKPIGIIDDNKRKKGTLVAGIKVLGGRENIEELVKDLNIDTILIAISKISAKDKKEIIEICQKTSASIKIVPGIYEIIGGKICLKRMRDVDLKDLLERDEIKLDKDGVEGYIKNKIVLVTGGGGSIGSELCRQIAKFSPKQLLILDIYENNAYDLENELKRNFKNFNHKTIIASVRDRERIDKVFKKYKPDVVFHAAAHKHVPLMETNPGEAIKNNVVGTLNVAEASSFYKVDKFVLISTDKAVNPTNIMGASKRLCEMIIQAMDKISNTEFVAVRFGNVLGSNGSVIPLFKEQIKNGGPVTLTHKKITRYFMLIPEAVRLVIQAGAYGKGGEIFVLDMGEPVKIYDLALKLVKLSGFDPNKDIEIKEIGLRPGEKLYEELLMEEEGLRETNNKKIFVAKPGNFNIEDIKKSISELVLIAGREDKEILNRKMMEVVPTYITKQSKMKI